MKRASPFLGALALVVAGCSTVNPTVGQLEQLKALAAAGRYQEVAAEGVDCDPSRPGCAQSHWIKADACRRLAAGAATDAADKGKQLDCAIRNYEAALTGAPDPAVSRDQVELGLLDTLLRRRDLARNAADADRYNTLLEERAMAAQGGPNARPAGHYYLANAQLNAVLRQTEQGGCAEIAQAAAQLDEARAEGSAFENAADALARAIANARAARGCPA